MGSPLSPVIANLFMEEFENSVLTSYEKKPTLWIRYVDDTFVIWPHGEHELENFLRHLNNQHDSIKFTMEVEKDGVLPFLDVLVTKKPNGKLGHGVYRKATHTDRYLHASSHHHPTQKAALISTLVHRAYSISDQISLPSEKRHLVTALANNGYHSDMVLKRTTKKEKELKSKTPSPKTEKPKAAGYAIIPYVAGTSEKIARLLRKFDVTTRFNCVKKTGEFLPTPKDRISPHAYEGVYEIECSCGMSYFGQTGRAVKCCIQEQRRA